MYKYLISFIVAVFFAALFISQCGSDDYDNEDDIEYESFDLSEPGSVEIKTTQRYLGDEEKVNNRSLSEPYTSSFNIEYNPSGLEIPKLSKCGENGACPFTCCEKGIFDGQIAQKTEHCRSKRKK